MKRTTKLLLAMALFNCVTACQTSSEKDSNLIFPFNELETFASIRLTSTSIGQLQLGMKRNEIPKSVEGLYDSYKIVHTPSKYDLFDSQDAYIYDKYIFYKDGKEVIEAYDQGRGLQPIYIHSTSIAYKGLCVNMPLQEAIKSGINVYTNPYFASNEGYVTFQKDTIKLNVQVSYSDKGYNKIRHASSDLYYDKGNITEVELDPDDVLPSSKISCFVLDNRDRLPNY